MPETIITAAAVVGCLVTAGVYFAFAVMVMPALAADPHAGTTVMREVNRWAVRPPFMTLFFGTSLLCTVVVVRGLLGGDLLAGLGAVGYLVGVVITVVGNVPLNNALARGSSGGSHEGAAWAAFAGPWSRLNLARVVVSALGGVLLLVQLLS